MVLMLILYTLRRLKVISITGKNLLAIKSIAFKILILLLILTVTRASGNPANENPKVFQIVKNQKVIGTIHIIKKVSGDSTIFNSESQIDAKLLMNVKITGKETCVFRNGILIYSSVYRTLNNKVKINHSITHNKSHYNINEGNTVDILNIEAIEQNLITLYFDEPKGVMSVLCDTQKEMINVKSLGRGKYKVEISKGKYNIFHYKNGRCIMIEAVSPMFDVLLMPL